jgi:hypothetical protein
LGRIASKTQYPGTSDRFTEPGNLFLTIDRLTHKRSPWLLLLFISIASLFPLLHQVNIVIIPLDPVKQEVSVVEVDLLGHGQDRWPNRNINARAAVRSATSKNNIEPRHQDPAIINNKGAEVGAAQERTSCGERGHEEHRSSNLHRNPASCRAVEADSGDFKKAIVVGGCPKKPQRLRCNLSVADFETNREPRQTSLVAGRKVDNERKGANLHQDLKNCKEAEAAVTQEKTRSGVTEGRRIDKKQRSDNLCRNPESYGAAEASNQGRRTLQGIGKMIENEERRNLRRHRKSCGNPGARCKQERRNLH